MARPDAGRGADPAATRIRPRTPPPRQARADDDDPAARGTWRHRLTWILAGVACVVAMGTAGTGALVAHERATPSPAPPTPATTPAPTATPTPTPTADATERRAAERAVTEHWQLILAGRYDEAYDAFAPGFQARIPRAGWVRAHAADRLSEAEVEVRPQIAPPGTTARAPVVSMRTVAASGCFTWTGAYDLQRIDGVWRIAGSHLTRRPC